MLNFGALTIFSLPEKNQIGRLATLCFKYFFISLHKQSRTRQYWGKPITAERLWQEDHSNGTTKAWKNCCTTYGSTGSTRPQD